MGCSSCRGQILIELLIVIGVFFFSTLAVVRLCEITLQKSKAYRFEKFKKERAWTK